MLKVEVITAGLIGILIGVVGNTLWEGMLSRPNLDEYQLVQVRPGGEWRHGRISVQPVTWNTSLDFTNIPETVTSVAITGNTFLGGPQSCEELDWLLEDLRDEVRRARVIELHE